VNGVERGRRTVLKFFVGDDWAEAHHDVEVMDPAGRVLAKARLPEGMAGMARLHALLAEQFGEADPDEVEVVVGIETDRGPWVAALVAAGYLVFGVNPLQASQYRKRHAVSGAKSDAADAHVLADMVRTDSHQLRPVAGDSELAEAIKVVTRAHKTLIWERTRHVQRLRSALREFFPAALEAFEDLDAPDTLELLGKAPDPARAAKLTRAQVSAALKRARRRNIPDKATAILAALRGEQLGQPPALTAAYAATARALIAVIATLNEQVKALQGQVEENFGRHPDAEIYRSQPGMGAILGARVLGEFGDAPHRYAGGKARRNYAATSPITRASGKKKVVAARFARNDRLADALNAQAFASLNASPGARACYDQLRARGIEHNDALRRLANRLVGILHGCLKTRTLYDEATAWSHRENLPQSSVAA
jgi:transposase